jgi:predicted kinase
LRAAVRMAVAMEAGLPDEAHVYRQLGLRLLQRAQPRLVAIGGLSGTGKTVVAQALAHRLPGPSGARVLRSDIVRKREQGLALNERAPAENYTVGQRADVYRQLATMTAEVMHAGASVIVDATFLLESGQASLQETAGDAALNGYWLSAPLEVRLARVSTRAGDASDADVAVAAAQAEPTALPSWWRRVDANRPVSEIADDIAAELQLGKTG